MCDARMASRGEEPERVLPPAFSGDGFWGRGKGKPSLHLEIQKQKSSQASALVSAEGTIEF